MRPTLLKLLLALTLCSGPGGCADRPLPAGSGIAAPPRPPMLPVAWTHADGGHCLSDAAARNLLINIERLNAHIGILEGNAKAGNGEEP